MESPIATLKTMLCDPMGNCSIAGSDKDRRIVGAALEALAAPIDMVLFCPNCGLQHIDESEWLTDPHDMEQGQIKTWDNPPHRSHLCHGCGYIWRPADVPTNGVLAIKTHGKADSGPSKFTMLPDPPQPIGTAGVALIRAVSGLVAIPKGGA